MEAQMMPAGTYWVGDPCYAIDEQEDWMALLNDAEFFAEKTIAKANGMTIAAVGTAYGDGCYVGSDGFEYGVDAGLLGVVPVADWAKDPGDLMRKVTFDEPFTVSTDGENVLIGSILIPTGDEDEEEDVCPWCGEEVTGWQCECQVYDPQEDDDDV